MSLKAKNVISGTYGSVWLDGDEMFEIKSFQAKDEYQKEEILSAGKMHKSYKITSVDGKGSVSIHKVTSQQIRNLGRQVREGKTPTFTIIAKLADPDAWGSERIAFKNVVFDDLTLFDFEVGQLGSVEMPFTYEDYDLLDLIAQKKWLKDNTNLDVNAMTEQEIKEANTQSNVFIAISLKVVDAMEDIVIAVEI